MASFSLGQVFVRKYGLIIHNLKQEDGSYITEIYTTLGEENISIFTKIEGFIMFLSLVVVAFVLLSFLKLRRLRT